MIEYDVETRFGMLCLIEDAGEITALRWGAARTPGETPLLTEAAEQVAAYDAGRLFKFELPLRVEGSDLLKRVCDEMAAISFGDTTTYGEIAARVGASAQAVGQACGQNPIPVIIPCHRVLGAGGTLTGYSGAGGVETKVALLRHEGAGSLLI